MKHVLNIFFGTIFSIALFHSNAQVTINPPFPLENQSVVIIFDASKGDGGLKGYSGDIYAHTGVITDKSNSSSDWKYVVSEWGENLTKNKLAPKGNDIYELSIGPTIRDYYGVPQGEEILQMAFVFRSADNSKTGRGTGGADIFTDLYSGGFIFIIDDPERVKIAEKNEDINFSATASETAAITLFSNNQEIKSVNGTSITHTFNFSESGDYWLKAVSTTNDTTISDSSFVHVKDEQVVEALPQNSMDGIEYLDNQSARLVLYAPGKENVFVLGDFNNWLPGDEARMKKDGDRFWLTLENLNPGKEYAFQYLVDGNIMVADPYTEKILDPWDDKYITNDVYPNLMPFPSEYTFSRVSVLQTNQEEYTWQTTTYPVPNKENLIIYELLIRDFTDERTYQAVMDTLGYLEKLGVNAIEFMPFNEFEGNSSWGYNPNFYFAPDKAYGTKNDLKKLIDECHKRGFIVIQDIVLNHAYNSCPLVKLYWDSENNRPSADNPWFNVASPNPVYSWGSDFNHESQATKDFIDKVTKFWMEEYKVDGFRFDFTKGFTNKNGDGSGYDESRIKILKRMADKVWEVNPNVFVILEHFAPDTEERELVNYKQGMLVWGNANYNFSEAAMGYNDGGKSNFSRASYQNRSFEQPGLVAYMESHDEERQLYKTRNFGNVQGSYITQVLATALDRSKLATTFFLSLPGPKMIYQFGELGYDFSINTCEDGSLNEGCRTSPKEAHWDYLSNADRKGLFNVYAGMNSLRKKIGALTAGAETLNLAGELKSIHLSHNDTNIVVLGNFGMTQGNINPNFQHTGTWYEYFNGQEYNITSTTNEISLQAGEYRLYADVPLPEFKDIITWADITHTFNDWNVYPNPTKDMVNVSSSNPISRIRVISLSGNIVLDKEMNQAYKASINASGLNKGMYILQLMSGNQTGIKKIIVK